MKKIILTLTIGLLAFTAAHAQQTVIVQKTPGLLEGLVDAAVAVATAPVVFGTAIVSGVEEVFAPAIVGSTRVAVISQTVPVVIPVPAAIAQPPPPAVVTPVPAVVPHAPAAIPTTTIITMHGAGTVTTVTRQASSYELGPIILTPVDPLHRVGPGPLVNPYIYRHR